MPRVAVKKSFSTRKTIWFIFYSLSVFLFPQSKVILPVKRWEKRDDNSHFQNTFMFLVLFFIFSNGSIFFCRLEKPWRTIAVLFSSQCFPIPRVVVKKSFSTRKNILFLYFLLSLCISFSTVQRCADCNAVRRTRTRRKRQRGGVFALAALIPALVAASKAAAAAHKHHHLIESGSKKSGMGIEPRYRQKSDRYQTSVWTPTLWACDPLFPTNWSAVSHPSQRVIPLRHVSVTKCPLLSDLSPRSPFPIRVSGFPNKNTRTLHFQQHSILMTSSLLIGFKNSRGGPFPYKTL